MNLSADETDTEINLESEEEPTLTVCKDENMDETEDVYHSSNVLNSAIELG